MANSHYQDPSEVRRIKDPADPRRCQGMTKQGQCINIAVEGGNYCLIHGGGSQLKGARNRDKSNYMLAQWQGRIERFKSNPDIKSLRDEIAILRMLLEERFNVAVKSPLDLLTQSSAISDLVSKIEKTVLSCHKLEASMGQHLDKSTLMQFAGEVCSIIGKHVHDEDTLRALSVEILESVSKLNVEDTDND